MIAVSIAQYARVAKDYLLLPHGMSVGRGYGPVVVALEERTLASLAGKRIGVPGLRTTAYLVLQAAAPRVRAGRRADRAVRALVRGAARREVEAALLIHEGRLFYEREGTKKVVDIGEAWRDATVGLPLPLGGNAIRRDLGPELVEKVSRVCRTSIRWALEHKDEVARALLAAETRADVGLDAASLDRYLDDVRERGHARCARRRAAGARRAVRARTRRGAHPRRRPRGARAVGESSSRLRAGVGASVPRRRPPVVVDLAQFAHVPTF